MNKTCSWNSVIRIIVLVHDESMIDVDTLSVSFPSEIRAHSHSRYPFINTERDASGSLSRPFATAELRDEPSNWLVTSCLTRRFRKLTEIADESRFDNSSRRIAAWLIISAIDQYRLSLFHCSIVNLLRIDDNLVQEICPWFVLEKYKKSPKRWPSRGRNVRLHYKLRENWIYIAKTSSVASYLLSIYRYNREPIYLI